MKIEHVMLTQCYMLRVYLTLKFLDLSLIKSDGLSL